MEKSNGGIAVWTKIYLDECEKVGIMPTLVNTEAIGKRAIDGNARRSYFDEIVRTKRIFSALKKALRSDAFDIVHINTSCGSLGLIRDYWTARKAVKKQPKAKIVTHFHCDIPYQIRSKIAKKYLQKLLRLSNENLVLCENSRIYLQEEFSAESIKVPNFVDEGLLSTVDFDNTTADKISKAFFVGRVSLAKGAKEIYEIAKRMPDITFELAGNVSAEVEVWQKPDNVQLLGLLSHDEVLKKMDGADIFFFPTHSEGFSMALAEAMSRGLPAVTTDVGANRDMIEEKGGIVTAVGDVDAMEAAISSLADKHIRAQMSKWSVSKVREFYLTRSVMNEFAEIYKKN